jgi:hypothetical protein
MLIQVQIVSVPIIKVKVKIQIRNILYFIPNTHFSLSDTIIIVNRLKYAIYLIQLVNNKKMYDDILSKLLFV